MSKKNKKETEPTAEQQKFMEVSAQIQKLLEDNGLALQPFLVRSEFGDRPSVRLVTVKATNNAEQETNTGADSVAGDEVGTAEASQS